MQVFTSYLLCVKVLSVVLVSAQCVISAESSSSTETADAGTTKSPIPGTTGTIVAGNLVAGSTESRLNANDLEKSTTAVSPTAVTLSETPSTLTFLTTTVSSNVAALTGTPSTTLENFTNANGTTSISGNFNTTTTEFRSSESTTTIPVIYLNTAIRNSTTESTALTTPVISSATEITNSTTESTAPTTPVTSSTTENGTTTTDSTTTEKPCMPSTSVNLTVTEILKTEVHLSVQDSSNETITCSTLIIIECNATLENNTMWNWVVQSQNISFDLNSTNPYSVVIGNLSEFTNYTCILTSSDYFVSDVEFFVQTEQEVPSSPVELNVEILNSSSFKISWQDPKKIPSILEGYEVTIIRKNVASEGHIWNNCSEQDTYIRNVTETSLLFEEALADFVYDVTVKAVSSAGYSDAANSTNSTPAIASGPPQNVTSLPMNEEYDRNITMIQKITWDIPCDTHGSVTYFQMELHGAYLYNKSRIDYRRDQVTVTQNQIYSYSFGDLWAATGYELKIYLVGTLGKGAVFNSSFETGENYPSAPKNESISISSRNMAISWKEPDNYPGNITNYTVDIIGEGVHWEKTELCDVSGAENNITKYVDITEFSTNSIVPDATYFIVISATTSKGQGNGTKLTVTSNVTYPDYFPISHTITNNSETENYDENVTIEFKPGCFNGKFKSYVLNYTGSRTGYTKHTELMEVKQYNNSKFTFSLRPQYSYVVDVSVNNEYYGTPRSLTFAAPAGVPTISNIPISSIPITPKSTEATLTLTKDNFDETEGSLAFLAIIVSDENVTGGEFNRWGDTSKWPTPEQKAHVYYQPTPTFWKPFNETTTSVEYVIGSNLTCKEEQYCNKPLEADKQYYVFLRLFNDDYYRNTMPLIIVTEKISKVWMSVGIIIGLLFLCAQGFIVFTLWRRGVFKEKCSKSHNSTEGGSDALLPHSDESPPCSPRRTQSPTTELSRRKFPAYSRCLEQSPAVLKAQWTDLEAQSRVIYEQVPSYFAVLPENRRKNRYTNILPFDHSRVKLNVDEDDELCSDYINASYIKGFSGENEYIATQGPLPGTCRDFWKMVLQEGVTIIVMVSRFIENNREKCYKYFPNNRETMAIIGDDIEVRCGTEIHFGFYCIRQLQVKKDLKQVTVTHMQYLEWPDFGVPSGTESMLQFCYQFQDRWSKEGGVALVHCSAGVGRTGTIIATDILRRAVVAGINIDVFNTVLDLRRDRRNMVQTEKQYMYIHQLIRSMIEFPIVVEQVNEDPIYANVDRNGIVESAL